MAITVDVKNTSHDEPPQVGRSHWPVTVMMGISSLINLFLPLVLVRLLSVTDLGAYKLFFLYAALVPAFAFAPGVVSGLAYWSGNGARGRTAISMSGWMLLGLALTVVTGGFLFVDGLGAMLGWPATTVRYFVVFAACSVIGIFFEEAAIAVGKSWTGAFFLFAFESLKFAVVLVVGLSGGSLEAVLQAYTVVAVAKVLGCYLLAIKFGLISRDFDSSVFKEVFAYSWPVSLAWVFGVFVEKADQLILSVYIEPEEFAIYALGCLAIPPIYALEQSITRVLIPQLSATLGSGKRSYAATIYSRAVEQLGLLIFPAVVGLALFAEPIVLLLFGPKYEDAEGILRVFALSYLALVIPGDAVARALGNSRWILKSFIGFSFVSLVFSYVGTIYGGVYGALTGFLLGRAFVRAVSLRYSITLAGWDGRECLPFKRLFVIGCVSLLLALTSFFARPLFSSPIVWFLVCGTIFFLSYFPIVFVLLAFVNKTAARGTRVAHLVIDLPLGGLERMVVNLAREMKREGTWQPFVYAYDRDPQRGERKLVDELQKSRVPFHYNKKGAGFSLKTLWRIRQFIRAESIDVLHAHNLGPLMYASLANILSGSPCRIVYTQHTLVHLEERRRNKWYEALFVRFASHIVVVSDSLVSFYKDLKVRTNSISYVPNGVEVPAAVSTQQSADRAQIAAIEPRLAHRLNCAWFVSVARLHPMKGQRSLVKLWSQVSAKDRENSVLILVGPESYPGEREEIERCIKKSGLQESILVHGATNIADIWLRAADCLVSASQSEGMPLVPLEALAQGTTCFLSDIDGHRFLRDLAQLFSLDQLGDAARALEALSAGFSSAAVDTRKSERSRIWVEHRFGIKACADAYASIYMGARGQQAIN